MEPLVGRRPLAFLIRVQRFKEGVRGQVVAVATGVSRLFDNLRDAMAFIEAQVREERDGQGEGTVAERDSKGGYREKTG